MKYHTLQTYKYMHHWNKKQLFDFYHQYIKKPNVVKTNLHYFIDGYEFPIFYVKTPALQKMVKLIYQNSTLILDVLNNYSMQTSIFLYKMKKEVKATNAIEGLNIPMNIISHTTHKLLNYMDSLHTVKIKPSKYMNFINSYIGLIYSWPLKIKHVKDLRTIYNHLFTHMFSKDVFPKQTLFRNKPIRIGNDYSTVYQPKSSEHAFLPDLKAWVKFINDDKYNPLVKAFIAHFAFESIHPFNDGNGRTGRYILCSYLSAKLDKWTAINFAQTIQKHPKLYYKGFQTLNNPLVCGDVTLFLKNMFKLVLLDQNVWKKELKINTYLEPKIRRKLN